MLGSVSRAIIWKNLSADKNFFKELLEVKHFIILLCWFQKAHYNHWRDRCR